MRSVRIYPDGEPVTMNTTHPASTASVSFIGGESNLVSRSDVLQLESKIKIVSSVVLLVECISMN